MVSLSSAFNLCTTGHGIPQSSTLVALCAKAIVIIYYVVYKSPRICGTIVLSYKTQISTFMHLLREEKGRNGVFIYYILIYI